MALINSTTSLSPSPTNFSSTIIPPGLLVDLAQNNIAQWLAVALTIPAFFMLMYPVLRFLLRSRREVGKPYPCYNAPIHFTVTNNIMDHDV